jgi:hypothetical protein
VRTSPAVKASFFIDGIANEQPTLAGGPAGLTATLAVFFGIKWKSVSDRGNP